MNFFFPIEIQARELPTRIAIALDLVENGHRVLICDQHILNRNFDNLPLGIFFHKDTSDCNAGKLFSKAKTKGHITTALDEEGLVYFSEEAYRKSRLGAVTMQHTDVVFCWGRMQKRIVEQNLNGNTKAVLSGHPKFEIQRHTAAQAQQYYLINTRFGSVNNGLVSGVDAYIKRMRLVDEVKDEKDEVFRRSYYVFVEELLSKFVEAIHTLAKRFPDEKFVIRPHPVESRKVYDDLSRVYDNVSVSSDQNSLEYDLKNAKAVIHNGCTTGIEALAMRKPVVVYEPVATPPGDMALPNKFGVITHNLESLAQKIADLNKANYDWDAALDGVDQFVENFSSGSSIDLISKTMQDLSVVAASENDSIEIEDSASVANTIVAALPKFLLFGPLSARRRSIEYTESKNPDLTLQQMTAKVEEVKATLNSDVIIDLRKVGRKSYLLEKRQ